MIGSWRQLFLVGKKLGRLITPVKFVISMAMMSQPLLLIMIKGEPVFLEGGKAEMQTITASARLPSARWYERLFHPDQDRQYRNIEYRRLWKEHPVIQSMFGKGCCMDNGAMENFFCRRKRKCTAEKNLKALTLSKRR